MKQSLKSTQNLIFLKKVIMNNKYLLSLITGLILLLSANMVFACSEASQGDIEEPKPVLTGYYDGPYIIYEGNRAVIINVIPGEGGPVIEENSYTIPQLKELRLRVVPDGRHPEDLSRLEPFELSLFDFETEEQWEFEQPEKIFLISDIECSLTNTESILRTGGVIDEEYNWIYGDGHLVVNGDMFSRGTDMMALLWFLYKLDYEAAEAGGKVHIIIGNHEAMNLRGDVRYVEDRYLEFSDKIGIEYADLFGKNTELGRWLRSKNSIIKIGRNLIAHGGISMEFVEREITPLEANELVRRDLGLPTSELEGTSEFVFRTWGLHWFRGMVRTNEDSRPVFTEDMPEILDYFDVDRVVVGHTKGPDILKLRERQVIVIDVNHSSNRYEGRSRALVIERVDGEDNLYRLKDTGEYQTIPDGD